ncbi:hypothetical protein ACOSP7_007182 [Xanthoceras sorbifolium]|uniref:DELLA protein RGL1-like n=1 Tax=Xanthoceras sorbifolium TaxID=99658 RepID=A0ABQ8IA14_9ROSI|nr:hypothetical protein JRO89_XS03G0157000 [Xanthoceras sorbifolium]
MANVVFSLEGFTFVEVPAKLSSIDNGFLSVGGGNKGRRFDSYGAEEWGESGANGSIACDYGNFYQDVSSEEGVVCSKYDDHHHQPEQEQQQQQQQTYSDYGLFDNLRFDMASPPTQTCLEENAKLSDQIQSGIEVEDVVVVDNNNGAMKLERQVSPFSLASLELLKSYGNGFKRMNGSERRIEPRSDMMLTKVANRKKLSTEEIMRVAGERFIRSSSRTVEDVISMLSNPFDLSFSGLSDEEIRDVELAEFLLASAEKVGDQQYDRATRLLNQCDYLSSPKGNPVQRIVYYFSEALRDKINRETGRITSKEMGKKQSFDMDVAMMSPTPTALACHEELPFGKVTQFAGIQAIVENVAEAKKIHIIDLSIKNGVQWTVLIQALASRLECPVELLKITAVGDIARHLIEETGKRLMSFSQSMNIPFSFNIVMVSDMLDIKEDLFKIDAEERVAVYAQFILRTFIVLPNRLENIMRVIRNINPCIMVVSEVEANHNSPVFVNRFIEALFYFSAYFDCMECCMKHNDSQRMIVESMFFSEGIRNIVATEGEERKVRAVKVDVWRAFFARYGMEEAELSMSSLYQADLVMKKFDRCNSCTINMDGLSLMTGWKGTPMHSLSVWKFI